MKKTLMTLAIVLLVCVAIVFALSACNFDKLIEDLENADYTENYDSANKEGSIELINAFFEETLKDPDFVVTCKNKDGEVQYTETVKGTDSYTLGKDSTKVSAYKKGDAFYVAIISQEEDDEGNTQEQRYYYCSDSSKPGYYADSESGTMEDLYKGNYCTFMSKVNGVNIVELLPEDKGTYSCKTHGEKKDGVTTGSLEFSFTADEGSITITASSEENKVKTITVSVSDGNTLTWTFVYGNASVELPDTDAWDREAEAEEARIAGNEKAIEDRDEFFAGTNVAENMVVTVKINGKTSYVETIANGIDCIDYGTHKVYTYMKEKENGEYDYYYVFDGEDAKYYMLNDDVYDEVVMFYNQQGICLYDEAGNEGATFACTVEGNTLTFTISMDGETLATLVAHKEGDTVSTATFTTVGDDGNVVMTYTFAYGEGSLTEPDLTDFDNPDKYSKDDAMEMLNDFFAETFDNTDQVSTSDYTVDGNQRHYVETIDGDKSMLVLDDSLTFYTFVQDDVYYSAFASNEGNMYRTGKEEYDNYRNGLKGDLKDLDIMPASSTFICKITSVDTDDDHTMQTLTLTATSSMGDRYEITATAKDGLVVSATYVILYVDEDGETLTDETGTISYEYGNAHVDIPDISDWDYIESAGNDNQ